MGDLNYRLTIADEKVSILVLMCFANPNCVAMLAWSKAA